MMIERHRILIISAFILLMDICSSVQLAGAQVPTGDPSAHPVSEPSSQRETGGAYRKSATASSIPRVVMLVFEKSRDEEVLSIVETLQVRMFDVDVKFGIRWMKPPTDDYATQLSTARALLARESVQLVIFWSTPSRDTLNYVMAEEDAPIQRSIRDVGNESRPEAMAIMVQTAVESLLETNQPEDVDASPVIVSPQPSRVPEQRIIKVSNRRRRISGTVYFPDMYIQMGYELDAANTDPTFLHGGNLRLGFQPAPAFRSFLGVGVVARHTSSELGFEVKQLRVPIELGFFGRYRRGDLAFGGGGSYLLVPLKNSPDTRNSSAALKSAYWTSGMMLRFFLECSYRFHEQIELFVNFHLLVDLKMLTYEVKNGPVLFDEYERLWPGMQAGITFLLF